MIINGLNLKTAIRYQSKFGAGFGSQAPTWYFSDGTQLRLYGTCVRYERPPRTLSERLFAFIGDWPFAWESKQEGALSLLRTEANKYDRTSTPKDVVLEA